MSLNASDTATFAPCVYPTRKPAHAIDHTTSHTSGVVLCCRVAFALLLPLPLPVFLLLLLDVVCWLWLLLLLAAAAAALLLLVVP